MRRFLILLLMTPFASSAGDRTFLCEIKQTWKQDDKSAAITEAADNTGWIVGTKFSVDKATGEVVGERVSTKQADDGLPVILSRGLSDQRGDKEGKPLTDNDGIYYPAGVGQNGWASVWWNVGTGSTPFNFLSIDEYKVVEGKHPFMLVTDISILTGWCE